MDTYITLFLILFVRARRHVNWPLISLCPHHAILVFFFFLHLFKPKVEYKDKHIALPSQSPERRTGKIWCGGHFVTETPEVGLFSAWRDVLMELCRLQSAHESQFLLSFFALFPTPTTTILPGRLHTAFIFWPILQSERSPLADSLIRLNFNVYV